MIRHDKPDIVTCDPTNYYIGDTYINHPIIDCRQVVIDSFPAAQNKKFFPELLKEGLEPHHVSEVWLALPKQPNTIIDVTKYWHKKLEALHKHASQIGDIDSFDKNMISRHTQNLTIENPQYEELFHRIVIRR